VEGRLNPETVKARVDELVTRGRALRRHDYGQMAAVADEAFELACQDIDGGSVYPYGMAAALVLMAHKNCAEGEWDATLSELAQAQALLGSDEPDLVLGEIYDVAGKTHLWLGNYGKALDNLMPALGIAERIGDRSLQAYVLDSIANVYSSSPTNVDSALELQTRALALHRELGDRMGEALILNNRAYTLMALEDLDAALASATAALEYASTDGREFMYRAVLDTLSDIHLRRGELEQARRCTLLSLEGAEGANNRPDAASSVLSLARVELEMGDLEGARVNALRSLGMFEALGATVELSESCHVLAEAWRREGDFAQALTYFERFHELREAHLGEASNSRIAELRVSYELENARKDAEILRLRSLALERQVEESRIAHARLEARASLDALTGLYNRGHLPTLEAELAAANARGVPASLLVLDVDRFKQINDTYGHLAGDRVLIEIARTIRHNARTTDMPVRYGGDEFLVLLVGLDATGALSLAERLREAIDSVEVRHEAAVLRATVSVGVAAVRDTVSSLSALIGCADHALYAAKNGGRDRTVVDC
jgi:diguanylate cyclase